MKIMDIFKNTFWLQLTIILFIKHLLCYATTADPSYSKGLALVDMKFSDDVIEASPVTNLTRQYDGDVFTANGIQKCNLDTCVGLSSGTASTISDTKITGSQKSNEFCNCHCHPHLSTYREDRGICVDDIHECTVSPFVSGSSLEKIPFVFLPLRGQIIYPSREISFPDIQIPICAVTGSQYLTATGWSDLRNPIDTDFPFRMFRDEGRTFLQWLGEADLRYKMEGRLILIHLMCRDMSLPANQNSSNVHKAFNKLAKNIFSPCVAFRVNGSPVKYLYNVSEVLFQPETTSNLSAISEGLSTKEYVVIGICSLLLGLIYVASVFLYLHVKKRKNTALDPRDILDDLDNDDINYPKNDQVVYGAPFTRTGSSYSVTSINDHIRNSQRNLSSGSNEEIGIIKNNPLLKHFPSLSDQSGFNSELSNSNSECEDNNHHHPNIGEKLRNNETYAIIHPTTNGKQDVELNYSLESPPSPTQDNECLPEENVSIIEDMGVDEKLEAMRALISGTVRKKLYFNPTYFEPQLLISPPPAAIEFLTKIREVIAIAKYKMASKKYQPSLIMIPEESLLCTLQKDNCNISNNSIINKLSCTINCPGLFNNSLSKCINCGDKHSSIQKWLETLPTHEFKSTLTQHINKIQSEGKIDQNGNCCKEIENNLQNDDNKINIINNASNKILNSQKTKPPILPKTAPKVIYHSLKTNSKDIDSNYNRIPMLDTAEVTQLTNYSAVAASVSKPTEEELHSFTETAGFTSSSQISRALSRNKFEILDHYVNPKKIQDYEHYELLCNMKQMPDMVYEALAKDYSMGMYTAQKSNNNYPNLNIPSPDYDSTYDKKSKDIYNRTHSSVLSIPTPDYSTLGKNNLRQYQPDSPVYRRKSPQYLIVDYETDSLERTTTNRKCSNSSSQSSNNSSDLSSQPSPSLSTALPMEEEVEIRHTVYDKVEGFRKDGDSNIKKKVPRPNDYEDIKTGGITKKIIPPRIIYDTPFRGSMTIEVQHEPLSDKDSTDSDQFEPDTLDRKPKKHSFCDIKYAAAWAEHLKKSKNFVNSVDDKVSYSSLENMTSLPDFSSETQNPLVLRSSSSFRSAIETTNKNEIFKTSIDDENDFSGVRPSFGSLREIYQSKAQRNAQRPKLNSINFTEQGHILSLEAKHSKRQRKNADDKLPKVMPPDVVPSKNDYFEIPPKCPPQKHNVLIRKNLMGWNTDDFNRLTSKNNAKEDTENTDTLSNHSQSTEITGVSDTQPNSEFDDDKKSEENQNYDMNLYSSVMANKNYDTIYNNKPAITDLRGDYSFKKYLSRKRDCDEANYGRRRTNNHERLNNNQLNLLELAYKEVNDDSSKNDLSEKTSSCMHNIQTVYRVEMSSPTNGMQIAMGLRDRAKKSKDFKNAWAKFLSLASSRFGSKFDSNKILYSPKNTDDKNFSTLDVNFDEGISSLIDNKLENSKNNLSEILEKSGIENNITLSELSHKSPWMMSPHYDNRLGGYRQELDSGYMSTESSEVYNRLCYEQYIFKLMADRDEIIKKDIEDTKKENLITTEHNKKETTSTSSGPPLCTIINEIEKPIKTNTCSSDEDETCNGSGFYLTESDEDGDNTEDMSESGAESIETHSVLFRNIKNYNSSSS